MSLLRYTHPGWVLVAVDRMMPVLWIITSIFLMMSIFFIWNAPEDYQQGFAVKIMFIHVPAAWLSLFCYLCMSVFALGVLIWSHPIAGISSKAMAVLGSVFTLLCLVTGAFWGRPIWGTWWVWDARLTSVLFLFFLYMGILLIWLNVENTYYAARAAAIIAIMGVINLPIIKFSVNWWNTLHQPASVLRRGGSAIHPELLYPLLATAGAFFFLMLTLYFIFVRNEILRKKIASMEQLLLQRTGTEP